MSIPSDYAVSNGLFFLKGPRHSLCTLDPDLQSAYSKDSAIEDWLSPLVAAEEYHFTSFALPTGDENQQGWRNQVHKSTRLTYPERL